MKEQILLFVIPLALISGCSRTANSSTPSAQIPAASSISPELARATAGEKAYKSTCSICHKSGLNGAPRIGSVEDWAQRVAQGNEVLYSRAINGYTGTKGSMPPRGSNLKLTDDEVKAGVDYMVEHSIAGPSAH